MSLPRTHFGYSVDEYLAIDRGSQERYEYLDGEIFAMAGESPAHGDICTNITGLLYIELRHGPCHIFSKDTKVRSGPSPKPGRREGLFSYPDVVIVCDEMQFHDEYRDVLLNPMVIFEVASPYTEDFDRREKWLRYQTWLSSLTDYVMVAQDQARVEQYARGAGGSWTYSVVTGLDGEIELKSVGCRLKLSDIYARVVFPEKKIENPNESFEETIPVGPPHR